MKAIAHASKKKKGKRQESSIAAFYRSIGIDARPMPMSGGAPGGMLTGDIAKGEHDGVCDEAKNAEQVRLWEWWEQAVAQAKPVSTPALHISGNNRPQITVIPTEEYFRLRLVEREQLGLPTKVKR